MPIHCPYVSALRLPLQLPEFSMFTHYPTTDMSDCILFLTGGCAFINRLLQYEFCGVFAPHSVMPCCSGLPVRTQSYSSYCALLSVVVHIVKIVLPVAVTMGTAFVGNLPFHFPSYSGARAEMNARVLAHSVGCASGSPRQHAVSGASVARQWCGYEIDTQS